MIRLVGAVLVLATLWLAGRHTSDDLMTVARNRITPTAEAYWLDVPLLSSEDGCPPSFAC